LNAVVQAFDYPENTIDTALCDALIPRSGVSRRSNR